MVDVITGDLPSNTLTAAKQSPFLSGLAPDSVNQDIDLLLGVNVLPRVMLEGRAHSPDYTMSASKSVYGWVVTGTCKAEGHVPRSRHCLKTTPINQQTQDLLTHFWRVEDVSSTSTNRTTEELAALEHFKMTHTRQEDGHYIVRLPRKENTLALACR